MTRSRLRLLLLAAFLSFAWLANRNVCPGCSREDSWLKLDDGTLIRARLYLPSDGPQRSLPSVIVSHGYLANLAFMEVPWAADLTHLGIAALFLDRRGHGWSEGQWWPPPPTGDYTRECADLAEAVRYLRARAPSIDPERIGILGHSDGGTSAIIEASLDWDIHATVALSASVAPWTFVNHVAPQNLLLMYGTEDDFVLNDTDVMLIAHATRGYLDGPGTYGKLDDGSARRLVRVPGFGHVTLLHSAKAREEALAWLRSSLQADGEIATSPLRLGWLWAGSFVLLLLTGLRGGNIPPASPLVGEEPLGRAGLLLRACLVVGLWSFGLLLFPWLRPYGASVPSQQGWVPIALFLTESLILFVVGIAVVGARRRGGMAACQGSIPRASRVVRSVAKGAAGGLILTIALQILLLHSYAAAFTPSRCALFVVFFAAALPAFALLESWMLWVERRHDRIVGIALGAALVATTAIAGSRLLVRMEILPVYIVAAALCFYTAYRRGPADGVAHAVFGAFVVSRALSVVCALY